ncbi:MAG: hypothetical protein HXX08_09510 [Chloroflexi bacterium]|uniref:Tetratricopeptide repeat protein n=1 Tax=Candidatus Chlorohelix allophototropha TaxID=3003348 RepID=A0A8T7M0A2_9CHLR|nr:hypothetical protein [Chloroflexota bacterium]WJW65481.1 hypothetical protein OZ401_001246 [Chloroflexota bacterium L227-S17]
MSPQDLEQFNDAISLAQVGHKTEAFSLLTTLLERNPNDANIMLWMAFTSTSVTLAQSMLDRVAQVEPSNSNLAGARSWLHSLEAATNAATSAVAVVQAEPVAPEPEAKSETDVVATAHVPTKVTEPEGKKKANLLFSTAFIIIVVALVGVVLVVLFTFFIGDRLAAQGLPVYGNATRLDLKSNDRDVLDGSIKVLTSMTNGAINNVQVEVYRIKRSELNTALKYYETELKKNGWTSTTANRAINSSGYAYTKDNNKMFTVSSGSAVPTFSISSDNYNIKSDEAVLTVMYMELDMGKITSLGK